MKSAAAVVVVLAAAAPAEATDQGRVVAPENHGEAAVAPEMRVLRTPDDCFENLPGYPFPPNYVEVDGLRIHYVDEGPKSAAPILMLHGEPTWSYLYRKMIPPLASAGRRVVAPDLIGFGRSDKPASIDDHSYARHVGWINGLIEGLGLQRITLVVHDWGALVGLQIAALHPERFARLVILNSSFNAGDDQPTPEYLAGFEAWKKLLLETPYLQVGLAVQANAATELPPDVKAAYEAPFPDGSYQSGVRILDSLIPWKPGIPGVEENRRARELLRQWSKPVLIAFSADSDRLHPGQRDVYRGLFPAESVWRDVTVEGVRHFMQEDKPDELAALIDEFITSTVD
jgi:haloalkane dehalogenase